MQQNIVLVGVGGAGVSSLAYLFYDLGYQNIIGIDKNHSEVTKKLENYGLHIIIGHGIYTVQQDDIVIYSDAVDQSPEVLAAQQKSLKNKKRVFPPFSYFHFLGEVSKYFVTISVAGTHGKSTTTALLGTALSVHHEDFGLAICGAAVSGRKGKNHILNPKHQNSIKDIMDHILYPKGPKVHSIMKRYNFVIEADEYNKHFLFLDTDYALITNCELDHADVYGNEENYCNTFGQFISGVRYSIFALSNAPGILKLQETQDPQHKIQIAKTQHFSFKTLLGAHNHSNASLTLAITRELCNKNSKEITTTLEQFSGLRRRGELLAENTYKVPIITDYGHHPTELASTLLALREKYTNKKITAIFQPHQARRVIEFRDQFVSVLKKFDVTIIYDIYTARESLENLKIQFEKKQFLSNIHSFTQLGKKLAKTSGGKYVTDFSEIQDSIKNTQNGVVIVITAGDLDWKVRKMLL